MGNQQSIPPTKSSKALHAAIWSCDYEKVRACPNLSLSSNVLLPAPASVRYFDFKRRRQDETGLVSQAETDAYTPLGALLSGVSSLLVQADVNSNIRVPSPQVVADIATALVSAGAQPNAPVQYTVAAGGGPFCACSGPATRCMRAFLRRCPTEARAKRAAYLEPTLLALLKAPGIACIAVPDVLLWAQCGCTSTVVSICTEYGDVLTHDADVAQGGPVPMLVPPLLCLVDAGLTRPLQWALEGGCDANVRDSRGRTPLMHACGVWPIESREGGWECVSTSGPSRSGRGCVEMLLAHGADVQAVDDDGNTALHWFSGLECPIDLTNRVQICQRLIRAGGRVNATNKAGQSALNIAHSVPRLELACVKETAWRRRRMVVQAQAGLARARGGKASTT